jgi:hypothetical protein
MSLLALAVVMGGPTAIAQASTRSGASSGAAAGRHVGGSVGGFVGGVTGAAVGAAGDVVHAATSPFRPRRHRHRR